RSKPLVVIVAFALGLLVGVAGRFLGVPGIGQASDVASVIGGMWLDAIRMTIIPLIFALLVTGIASTVGTASAGGFTVRLLGIFVVLLTIGTVIIGALAILILQAVPIPALALE